MNTTNKKFHGKTSRELKKRYVVIAGFDMSFDDFRELCWVTRINEDATSLDIGGFETRKEKHSRFVLKTDEKVTKCAHLDKTFLKLRI